MCNIFNELLSDNGDNVIVVLKYIIIGLCLYYVYLSYTNHSTCRKIETFNNKHKYMEVQKQSFPNIYDVLTKKCDQRYCNANIWSPNGQENPLKLEDDEVMSNYTSDGKCCVIKKDVMDFLINRGNNA
jgi:hypothetical protein